MTRSPCTRAHRGLRFRFTPQLQLIEVLDRDLAPTKPIKQVIAESGGKVRPLNFRHLFPEGQPSQFLLNTLSL
jgi:hypothetical protein